MVAVTAYAARRDSMNFPMAKAAPTARTLDQTAPLIVREATNKPGEIASKAAKMSALAAPSQRGNSSGETISARLTRTVANRAVEVAEPPIDMSSVLALNI